MARSKGYSSTPAGVVWSDYERKEREKEIVRQFEEKKKLIEYQEMQRARGNLIVIKAVLDRVLPVLEKCMKPEEEDGLHSKEDMRQY